jgi:hypothetical protein
MAFPNVGGSVASSRPANPIRAAMMKGLSAKPPTSGGAVYKHMPTPQPPAAMKGSVALKMAGASPKVVTGR